jgi:hypothetical protein
MPHLPLALVDLHLHTIFLTKACTRQVWHCSLGLPVPVTISSVVHATPLQLTIYEPHRAASSRVKPAKKLGGPTRIASTIGKHSLTLEGVHSSPQIPTGPANVRCASVPNIDVLQEQGVLSNKSTLIRLHLLNSTAAPRLRSWAVGGRKVPKSAGKRMQVWFNLTSNPKLVSLQIAIRCCKPFSSSVPCHVVVVSGPSSE